MDSDSPPPQKPTISDMPPEVLINIFDWATKDDGLLDHVPSYKHYTFSNPDPSNPWHMPSMDAFNTANAIALVCSHWRSLSSEFYLRHIVVQTISDVEYYINQLCLERELRHWVKRLTLAIVLEDELWTHKYTKLVCELIELCTHLEVFGNGITARRGETHDAATPVLASASAECTSLKRAHWRPVGCMQLRPFAWSTLLGGATNLEALHVDCPSIWLPQHNDPPADMPRLSLPALHSLRLRVDETHAWLAKEMTAWDLPQLRHMYLQSEPHVNTAALAELLEAHGQGLKTIAIDAGICSGIPPSLVLHLCGESLEEMLIPDFVTPFETRCPSVKTVVCVRSADISGPLLDPFLGVIKWVTETDGFPSLKRIVIVNPTFDNMEEKEARSLRGREGGRGVEIVNRRGLTICSGGNGEWVA